MTTGLKDLLRVYLRVIMESFNFDHPKQIAAAMKRLRFFANLPELLDMDERSLDDDSVKTCKVSNTSTQIIERDLEGLSLFCCQRDASGDNVRNVSLRSSLRDVSGWSDQDLYDLS